MRLNWLVVVLLGLVGAAPVPAQEPATGSWGEELRRLRAAAVVAPAPGRTKAGVKSMGTGGKGGLARALVPRRAGSVTATAAESEPNESVQTADSVALGDRATGVIDPVGDVDTWFVDLTAGQFFSVDVDASESGSPLDPTLTLIAPDGTTLLAVNDDFDGLDSRISFHVPTSGRYYVVIRAFGGLTGGPAFAYTTNFGTVTCAGTGTEREPNGNPGAASPIAIGGTGSGEICAQDDGPAGDVDYWAFTAQAGTTIELDVDAAQLGALVDPVLALVASDGTTRLAFNDDADGTDSRLQFSIITAGTYYATISDAAGGSGNPFSYLLHLRSIAPGPGDPVVVRGEGLGFPVGLAVGGTGDLFATDFTGNRVVRISGEGGAPTRVAEVPLPVGLAFDAFGNLLVASLDGDVYRVTPQGQATRFITDAGAPFWVAVGADGRIWISDVSDRSLRRYGPTGLFEARFDASSIGGSGPGPLAIGPSGEPHFSSGSEIWKLVNGQLRRVIQGTLGLTGFAFDVAGNIYAASPAAGRIQLFNQAGALVADTFAIGPDAPQAVAFGRDGTGATVARLFATEPRVGQVIEMNPAGVEHPGQPVGFVPLPITPEVAAATLLGGGGLGGADLQSLDARGNGNGRYDVGDLQAYLRTVGGLPATAAAAQPRLGSDR